MGASSSRTIRFREGQSWLADVPALAGTHTWARNLPANAADLGDEVSFVHVCGPGRGGR
jgi:hypothetical protein